MLLNQRSGYVVINSLSGLKISTGYVTTTGHNGTDEVIVVAGFDMPGDTILHRTRESAEKELFERRLKGE